MAEHLELPYDAEGPKSTKVSVTSDFDDTTLNSPKGILQLPCHRRFMLKPGSELTAQNQRPPHTVIYFTSPCVQVFKARGLFAQDVTCEQFTKAHLVATAVRVPSDTLVSNNPGHE